eukprot:TRINITY_DN6777_c0_g1_i1.p1 TRINITY_DN6777_c0_g1~~TRINITY_DN6777_c0_g1_i1.p1  ORF type:complete len:310 (-),score=66.28 TRINITY_DN6777_c0_g1_i1:8-937(-)
MLNLKMVVVGDGAVGKSSFLISFTMNAFMTDYVPTTFDNYNAMIPFEDTNVFLGLWDTAGQADFEKLRPISYKQADVYLLFFSVINPTSLENVKEQWVDEVVRHSPNAPYFLVGTQIDERDNDEVVSELESKGRAPITSMMGAIAAKEIGAKGYFEISAKEMRFGNLFEEVIRYVFNISKGFKKKKHICWSIKCRTKLKSKNTCKCKGCNNYYCTDCMEYWTNGEKWCPHCAYKRVKEISEEGGTYVVKKPRKSPEDRLREKEEKFKRKVQKHLDSNPDINVDEYIANHKDSATLDITSSDDVLFTHEN